MRNLSFVQWFLPPSLNLFLLTFERISFWVLGSTEKGVLKYFRKDGKECCGFIIWRRSAFDSKCFLICAVVCVCEISGLRMRRLAWDLPVAIDLLGCNLEHYPEEFRGNLEDGRGRGDELRRGNPSCSNKLLTTWATQFTNSIQPIFPIPIPSTFTLLVQYRFLEEIVRWNSPLV